MNKKTEIFEFEINIIQFRAKNSTMLKYTYLNRAINNLLSRDCDKIVPSKHMLFFIRHDCYKMKEIHVFIIR